MTGGAAQPLLPAAVAAALRDQVLAIGSGSWPAPELRLLGGDGVRELQSALLPVAKATLGELQAMHPSLTGMSAKPGELSKVMARMVAGGLDDATFSQWAQGAGVMVMPPEPTGA
ncbi:hypothetical protein FOA52_005259 [Chlamydomonas sp. UWO 241]|nr:hypothetical protein FOA52_005259 [Chlamydomonas sp. UWO 241]